MRMGVLAVPMRARNSPVTLAVSASATVVLAVPMRARNTSSPIFSPTDVLSFGSTYEGSKHTADTTADQADRRFGSTYEGSKLRAAWAGREFKARFGSTYEGSKQLLEGREHVVPDVLAVPMRARNSSSFASCSARISVLAVPMRARNLHPARTAAGRADGFGSTYEGSKLLDHPEGLVGAGRFWQYL